MNHVVTINDNSDEIKVTNCNDNDKEMIYRQDTIDVLNESIKHFDDMAEECRRNANIEQNDYMDMRDAAIEYRQLSIWLNELKWLRERFQSQPDLGKYEYHYDHTDCIWYRPEARNRCPVTCAQYRDGWNDAMNYIFRDGKGYRPYRRGEQYEE